MKSPSFALSAASLFLAAACGSSSSPAPAVAPSAAAPADGAAPVSAAGMAPAAAGEVKCLGINGCKGQAACDMPGKHGCAGQNECKGKGWILVAAADCSGKGGTVKP